MCKLAAMVNFEAGKRMPAAVATQVRKTVKHLFYINSYGQTDGSGIMLMDTEGNYGYHKRAIPSPDFIETKWGSAAINSVDEMRFMALHTRFGTVGNNSDNNSHPFLHGNTLLMQNGTIDPMCDQKRLVPTENCPCEVDSEAVAWAIDKQGVHATMQQYEGAGVFMWLDIEDSTFHILKNDERNLHLLKVKHYDIYIYGTDYHALALAASRSGLQHEPIQALADDKLHTYTLDRKYFNEDLEVPSGYAFGYNSWSYGKGASFPKGGSSLGKRNTPTKRLPSTGKVTSMMGRGKQALS